MTTQETKNKRPCGSHWQRTPISYYGGKQTMLPYILPLIPEHQVYIEPFFGGGAVFWAKQPSKVEIINDFNANVINFYEVVKTDFQALTSLIDKSIVSREAYKSALVMYHSPFVFSPLQRAWAFWYVTNNGFSNEIGNCRFDKLGKNTRGLANKVLEFSQDYSERLKHVQLENTDACEVIKKFDSSSSFIYCDPPYVGARQGHYGGYEQEHFNQLLEALSQIKGKFLLSSYQNKELSKYAEQLGWSQKEIVMSLGSSNIKGAKRREILTANFKIDN
ncbi:DNA adenine methylase [Capnocytophaga catalasegens]|uniref:site-specific DNA-methyltransferase (adenine-specific) n=1 Tax=Capnocytophaga catalasegens TaxID=1004260 RepID=A0AAV5AVI7_9FLAO|nr:DNA adenine methylase [Capnocytophaga catalasegens]GIZ15269.1 DNA methyltransferase [Capnocytophaga catalasegens]GJM51403.1 DNA methyltransferase [Capnocytophaga catalasegens]GJM54211.1 DNA methyltransferase [Capnocytophaga catalasegens]